MQYLVNITPKAHAIDPKKGHNLSTATLIRVVAKRAVFGLFFPATKIWYNCDNANNRCGVRHLRRAPFQLPNPRVITLVQQTLANI